MEKLRRELHRELTCVNRAYLWLFSLGALILGILFAIGGVNRFVYGCLLLPRGALPPFLLILLWGLMLFVFGASVSLAYSSPLCLKTQTRQSVLLLFLASLVLCYVWIPMVYKAASFFLALLVLAVLFLSLAVMLLSICKTHRTAAIGIGIFALWIAYIFYYTFALFLLN